MTPYVAGVVKRLTRRIVAPLCVGSSPTTRPIFFYLKTGIPGEIGTGSLIWGYRQAVRQRTLTPLSVVRLHLPLPVIKSCRQSSAGFFAWAGRTAARLPLIAYRYPLFAIRPTVILHRSGDNRAKNLGTSRSSYLRRLMTQHWIKIHMKSDSANESVLP